MSNTLLIRADGNIRMGTGHVMRCLSLAQGWRHGGGDAVFTLAESTPGLEYRLRSEDFDFVRLSIPFGGSADVAQTVDLARRHAAAWVIADGYQFGADYQSDIKAAGLRLLVFDDYGHAGHYYADWVLNQNLTADAQMYQHREKYSRLLLGPRYVLLQEQFQDWHNWKRSIPIIARKILVTLGGSDPDNVTGRIVEALRDSAVQMKVVIGGSNPHLQHLSSIIRHPSLVIHDATNMSELMAWADIAIAAGGTTSSELMFMGVPMAIVILAENQEWQAQAIHREGAGINLGRADQLTTDMIRQAIESLQCAPGDRQRMSARAKELVDGDGTERVIQALRTSPGQTAVVTEYGARHSHKDTGEKLR